MKKLMTLLLAVLVTTAAGLAKPAKASVQYGPWIQNVTETGFTVLFKTPAPTLAYVEVAPDDGSSFYNLDRPRFYETVAGRRLSGTMHRIRVSGLEPGKAYRYRVHGKPVIDDSNAYGTVWGPEGVIAKEVGGVRTLDRKATECRFSVVNDMHAHFDRYATLTRSLKPADLDFFVMNGDMVSYVNSIDTMMRYTFDPARELLRRVPSLYVRGNHESRGREFDKVPDIFDSPTGEFYFQFRQGPCAFLVLDGGEDKPDTSGEYSGTADYDSYRLEELAWLKKAVQDPDFRSAPWKIVLIHIPMISHISPWYSQQWLCDHMLPVLNEAGVDLMISGHHHRYIYTAPGEKGNANRFPIVINSNVDRLDCRVTSGSVEISITDIDGKEIHRHSFKK